MASDDVHLPKLALICLGAPTVRIDNNAPEGSVIWRKNLALLVYLALADRHTASRGHLVGLLWPEKPEERARHSLNEAVRRLRGALGPNRLVTTGEQLTLATEALDVDAIQFERLIQTDPAAASELPAGEFLEGLSIDDAPPFEQWAAAQRERYNSLWAASLISVGENALASGALADAEAAARRALRVQPYHERAASLLIRSAALSGDVSGAQAVFRDFSSQFATDVGGVVGPDLQELIDRVRSGRWQVSRGAQVRDEPPLAGRQAVHRSVFAALSEVPRKAVCLVISGGPGMGKTRLINECLERAALDGALVVVARPLESDQDAPWSALRSLMRAGLSEAPGMAGAPPHALATLAGLVPDLAQRYAPSTAQDRAEIVGALAGFMAAVCEEKPVVIAIDDAHLADRSTLEVLEALLPQAQEFPMGLLLAVGAAASTPPELLRLQSGVGRSVNGSSAELEPLDDAALHEMVDALAPWCKTPEDADRLTRRLGFEVEGNPQLAVTILRALGERALGDGPEQPWPRPRSTIETPFPFTLPALLRSAVLARMDALADPTKDLLQVASVGSLAIDVEMIAQLVEASVEDVELRLEELERHGFVRFQDERYVFVAPLLKKAVEESCLTPGRHQRICRKAIELLETRSDPSSALLRLELLAKTADAAHAFDEALGLARTAMANGAFGTARRALAAAELAAGDDRDRAAAVVEARSELTHKPPPVPAH
jgi:DNA-binding SARP family transcriptional activator